MKENLKVSTKEEKTKQRGYFARVVKEKSKTHENAQAPGYWDIHVPPKGKKKKINIPIRTINYAGRNTSINK